MRQTLQRYNLDSYRPRHSLITHQFAIAYATLRLSWLGLRLQRADRGCGRGTFPSLKGLTQVRRSLLAKRPGSPTAGVRKKRWLLLAVVAAGGSKSRGRGGEKEIAMKRTMFVYALLAATAVALGAQQASQSNPYQGTSNPPPDDQITTPAPQAPPAAKPSPSHPAYAQPVAPAQPQQPAAQPASHPLDGSLYTIPPSPATEPTTASCRLRPTRQPSPR